MSLMRYSKALSLALSSLLCFSSVAFGFGSQTHESVTKYSTGKISQSCDALKSVKGLNEKELSVLEDIQGDYNKIVVDGSLKPDDDENKGGFKYHFFNPVTERNYMGEKENASSKCVEHFENALNFYRTGDKPSAYEELGRSVHFLEDANTCVHTGYDNPTDSVVKLPMHIRFEKKCDIVSEQCNAEVPAESLEYYEVNSVEDIVKSSAVLAMDNFYRLENIKNDENKLACNAVLNAQKRVAGLIYKFIKEACKLLI